MLESSVRPIISGSVPVVGTVLVVSLSRWLRLCDREAGGGPCGRVNIVRNQAEVILSVIEGTQKRTPSDELSTTSASKENNG